MAEFDAEMEWEDPNSIASIETIDIGALSAADARFADAVELGRQRAERDIQARISDLGEQSGPWSYSDVLGEAASDTFDRALLSVMGILAASKQQNVYYVASVDSEGHPLRGDVCAAGAADSFPVDGEPDRPATGLDHSKGQQQHNRQPNGQKGEIDHADGHGHESGKPQRQRGMGFGELLGQGPIQPAQERDRSAGADQVDDGKGIGKRREPV